MAKRIAYVNNQIILDIPALQASARESRVKKSLLALLTQEHDFAKRHKEHAYQQGLDDNDGDGMGAGFCKMGANLKTQEAVLGILAPLVPTDDGVYTAFWETALGTHSNIRNLSYGAIDTLSAMTSRKEDLLTKARDPRNKIYERTCAYTILCLPHLPGEQGVALLEEIAQDQCVQNLYQRNKELSPDAVHELEILRIQKIRGKGSTQRAVDEAQRRMHLAVFDVVWHAVQHSP
ncbi:MAG TPA: hypothetical protein VJH22_03690, partial [Candidatus Nanoarchaeia archaeon]|nr:hypothetical protein [Candidatus Nanoarchaeia archaeon]